GKTFAFASELKAFRGLPAWRPEIDRGALTLFMRHGYVPAPYAIYEGIRKLRPGHLLKIRQGEDPRVESYWSARIAAQRGHDDTFKGDAAEAVASIEELLRQSIG